RQTLYPTELRVYIAERETRVHSRWIDVLRVNHPDQP
ncbi:hypothetical protein KIPB_011645, partial [Kipferlia bialata]